MDSAGYASLNRQSGLLREISIIAQNIANSETSGFRREGLVFSEYVRRLDGGAPSLSMATGNARMTDLSQAQISHTGGTYDLAIEGQGFFLVETPRGQRLTRAGAFSPDAEGELVTPEGHRLLDGGGAPVFVPAMAQVVSISSDGTLSANGQPVAQIGLWLPVNPLIMTRDAATQFAAGPLEPVENGVIRQGFLEGSNVEPLTEIARMVEVQRSYELGQSFLEREDERIRKVVQTLGE
jgi:flagellar basal-body rod protein FlgF